MLVRQCQIRFWVVSTALLVFTPSPCLPTTIVAIRTPEVFAIAADTEGTFKGGSNPTTRRSVSKIFEKGGVLYAISGLTKDSRRGFDPADAIAASLRDSQSLLSIVTNVEAILSKALKEELAKLQTEEPVLFCNAIEGDNAVKTVLLASFEKEQPIAIGINFLGAVNTEGKLVIRTTRLACPGDCPNGMYTFFLGHHKAIDKYIAERGAHLAMSPEEGVRFMAQLEIDAKTPGVGPPIDMVRLNQDGIKWLSRTQTLGQCRAASPDRLRLLCEGL
jgi:hypothetical protein